jgi:hypothetical protein
MTDQRRSVDRSVEAITFALHEGRWSLNARGVA